MKGKPKMQEQPQTSPLVKDLIKSITQSKGSDRCVRCGETSDYGAHGLTGGEVYSVYYCEKHYFAMKRGSA